MVLEQECEKRVVEKLLQGEGQKEEEKYLHKISFQNDKI